MKLHETPPAASAGTASARLGLALWLAILAFCFAPAAMAGTVVFEDSNFNDADWSFRFIDFGFVEIQIPTDRQFLADGNPDAYREIHIKIPPSISDRWGLFGVYSKAGATYEPSTQGAIEAIHYSEDAVNLSTSGQLIGLSIIQEHPDEDPPIYCQPQFLVQRTRNASDLPRPGAVCRCRSSGRAWPRSLMRAGTWTATPSV